MRLALTGLAIIVLSSSASAEIIEEKCRPTSFVEQGMGAKILCRVDTVTKCSNGRYDLLDLTDANMDFNFEPDATFLREPFGKMETTDYLITKCDHSGIQIAFKNHNRYGRISFFPTLGKSEYPARFVATAGSEPPQQAIGRCLVRK